MKRRSFFSRLAGLALLPALARFASKPELMWVSLDEYTDGRLCWHGEWSDGYSCEVPAHQVAPQPEDTRVFFGTKCDAKDYKIEMDWFRVHSDGSIRPI